MPAKLACHVSSPCGAGRGALCIRSNLPATMDKCQGKAYVHASSEVSTIVSQQKGANQANQIGKAKGSIVSTTVYAVHPYAIVHRFFFFEGMFIFLAVWGRGYASAAQAQARFQRGRTSSLVQRLKASPAQVRPRHTMKQRPAGPKLQPASRSAPSPRTM